MIRSVVSAWLGAFLLSLSALERLFTIYGAAAETCAALGVCGFCLLSVGLQGGVPGGVAFPDIKTKAGWYGDEAQSPRNGRLRKAFESWSIFQTPYLVSGEFCTILQFLWKPKRGSSLRWERVWVEASDKERVASDWVFPPGGYNPEKPVVVILPGLAPAKHWTETSEFVADAALHVTQNLGTTAVVFIPRGSMGTEVREHLFHGARVADVREVVLMAEEALRAAGGQPQAAKPQLFGVGFSLGGMLLANYCGQFGGDERFLGCVCLSGMNDCTENLRFEYATKTWHVALAIRVKKTLLTGRTMEHARKRGVNLERVMSTKVASISSWDHEFTAPYHGFDGVEDFYVQGSLTQNDNWKRVAVPLLNVAARDDPITHCDSMRAQELSAGNSNLLFFITERGGHTGWPVGWKPWANGYDFMNGAIERFINGVTGTSSADEQCSRNARGVRNRGAMPKTSS